MLFNSFSYLLFLPLVYIFYWHIFQKNLNRQNIFLLLVSYFFYACWDWRFLFLLLFSTLLDYVTGIKLESLNNRLVRKIWLIASISINLGFLGLFKYYDFFILSFKDLLSYFGFSAHLSTLNIILPVGISFYTFHGLSYVIDVYKQKISSEKNFIQYALFVSFFPLLVAGPIERATHLLPQLKVSRIFNYSNAVLGLRQILWGFFKKVVIADNCALYVNDVFAHSSTVTGSTLLISSILFSVQIYCDFSGYSDIALGTARLFGIDLLRNFAFPYFSRDIAEFWRRWHISLSSWFRDYLYIPLGGSKGNASVKIRNTFIIFLVSGFWHGANWTFIIWGLLNAVLFIPLLLLGQNRSHLMIVANDKYFPSFKEFFQIILTFLFVTLAWIFFRSESVSQALSIIFKIFSSTIFLPSKSVPIFLMIFILFLFVIEWFGRRNDFALQLIVNRWPKYIRIAFYYFIIIILFLFGGSEQEFIYFQF